MHFNQNKVIKTLNAIIKGKKPAETQISLPSDEYGFVGERVPTNAEEIINDDTVALVISDGHSNPYSLLPLVDMIDHILSTNATRDNKVHVIYDGDLTGYLPFVNTVVDYFRKISDDPNVHILFGNHDEYVLNYFFEKHNMKSRSNHWTNGRNDSSDVAAKMNADKISADNINFLARTLRGIDFSKHGLEGVVAMHDNPLMNGDYLKTNMAFLDDQLKATTDEAIEKLDRRKQRNEELAKKSFRYMQKKGYKITLVGHSHEPFVMEDTSPGLMLTPTDANRDMVSQIRSNYRSTRGKEVKFVMLGQYELNPDRSYIINSGSYSQPRMEDGLPHFGTLERNGNGFRYKIWTFAYDFMEAQKVFGDATFVDEFNLAYEQVNSQREMKYTAQQVFDNLQKRVASQFMYGKLLEPQMD